MIQNTEIAQTEDAIKVINEIIIELIRNNEIEYVFELLNKYFSSVSKGLSETILLNEAGFNYLKKRIGNDEITDQEIRVENKRLERRLLYISEERVPNEVRIQQMLGKLNYRIFRSSTNAYLEKILGPNSYLVKVRWLETGIKKSKSVCQVVRSDEKKGSGFLLKGGYLMTNQHVIPNKKQAKDCKIVFDFEEDLMGNMRKTSEFRLDPSDSKFSRLDKYDYAFIKVKDNPSNPLSQWGYLELDTFSEPQLGNPVSIIQHPLGGTKQIAITGNNIIARDGCKLFYQTDTERGSSGSPVFNWDWKVIALHHAGRKEEDGGLTINSQTGERRGANEGILIKCIAKDLGIID